MLRIGLCAGTFFSLKKERELIGHSLKCTLCRMIKSTLLFEIYGIRLQREDVHDIVNKGSSSIHNWALCQKEMWK